MCFHYTWCVSIRTWDTWWVSITRDVFPLHMMCFHYTWHTWCLSITRDGFPLHTKRFGQNRMYTLYMTISCNEFLTHRIYASGQLTHKALDISESLVVSVFAELFYSICVFQLFTCSCHCESVAHMIQFVCICLQGGWGGSRLPPGFDAKAITAEMPPNVPRRRTHVLLSAERVRRLKVPPWLWRQGHSRRSAT